MVWDSSITWQVDRIPYIWNSNGPEWNDHGRTYINSKYFKHTFPEGEYPKLKCNGEYLGEEYLKFRIFSRSTLILLKNVKEKYSIPKIKNPIYSVFLRKMIFFTFNRQKIYFYPHCELLIIS